MANVIHVRRQPTGLEQAGQSMQDLTNNFIQQTLAMTQQQNAQNMQMMGLGMQERRLADANARDDRRWKEYAAMQERRFAQEDKWKEAQLALQKQQLAHTLSSMNKPTLVEYEDEYGVKRKVWGVPGNPNVTPINFGGASGGTGGGSIPGLDAAFNAAADEVLQPDWSPSSPMGRKGLAVLYPHLAEGAENPSPVASIPTQAEVQLPKVEPLSPSMRSNQSHLARTFDLLGVKFPQNGQPQQADVMPESAAPEPQQPTAFAPGTVVDGSGNPVQLPANVPWGKQEKQYVGGKEYYGTRTPNGLFFKIGGEVPLTTAERKELKALEKVEMGESDARASAGHVLDAVKKAKKLVGQGNFGILPVTGAGSILNFIPGTTGRDLEGLLVTIKANSGFDKLQQMRATSPTGAALGPVSDFENKQLQATIANLETSQSEEQFLENLQKVEDVYNRIINGTSRQGKQGGNAGQAGGGGAPTGSTRLTFNPQTGRLE